MTHLSAPLLRASRAGHAPGFRQRTSKVGFPIRISVDQSSFAAPHGFSQRSTSFIACAYQGIHRTPFIHSITLITNARPKGTARQSSHQNPRQSSGSPPAYLERHAGLQTSARRQTALGKGPERTSVTREFSVPSSLRRRTRTTLLFTMSANRRRSRPKRPNRRKPFFFRQVFFVGLKRRRGHPSP